MRDAEAARIACHDSTDPCRPWAGSACLLGEGYARRVAEGRAEGLATLAQVERAHIARVLEHAAYNYRAAAKILGISRSTLYVKVAAMRAERAAEQQPAEGGAA